MRGLISDLIYLAVIASLLLLTCKREQPKPSLTPEEWQWLAQNEKIRLGSDPFFSPVAFIDENGKHSGLTRDIFTLIEQKLNIKFIELPASSWEDILNKCKSYDCDIIGAIHKTKSRTEYLSYSQPYINIPAVIIVNSSIKKHLSLKKLNSFKVAIPKGYAIVEHITKNYPEIKPVLVKNDLEALTMVSTGEVYASISDLATASHLIGKNNITDLRVAGETNFTWALSIASRKDWPILNSIIIKTLSSISKEDIEEIKSKWIKINYSRYLYSKEFWNTVLIILGLIILCVCLLALWNKSLVVAVQHKTEELNSYKNHLEDLIKARTDDLENSNQNLQEALKQVKTLQGLLPICSNCNKVRDDKGYWSKIEKYIGDRTNAEFSHSLCPDCTKEIYGNEDWYDHLESQNNANNSNE